MTLTHTNTKINIIININTNLNINMSYTSLNTTTFTKHHYGAEFTFHIVFLSKNRMRKCMLIIDSV